jgi:hypothetical protein
MNKRDFLTAFLLGATALPVRAAGKGKQKGPTLLTISGAIAKRNRGALDPALDQLMLKQKLHFDSAFCFDFAALASLPAQQIRPTLEYDSRPHALSGPLLTTVLETAGAGGGANPNILLRAIDGYAVVLPLADVRALRMLVATHLDGEPLPLGGLGPLWAVFDADRIPSFAAKPLKDRFANCPWGLYHIEVQALAV